jgi:hypothetical protein
MTPREEDRIFRLGIETMREAVLHELAGWKDEHGVAKLIEHHIEKLEPKINTCQSHQKEK